MAEWQSGKALSQPNKYKSLYQYFGKPAGSKIGYKIGTLAIQCGVQSKPGEPLRGKQYAGKTANTYPLAFLDLVTTAYPELNPNTAATAGTIATGTTLTTTESGTIIGQDLGSFTSGHPGWNSRTGYSDSSQRIR